MKTWQNIANFVWSGSVFIFSSSAIFFALYPPPLPNTSLIFYGLTLFCLWQLFLNWQWSIGSLLSQPPEKYQKKVTLFFFLNILFLYTTGLSCFATYTLFPHPIVHKILAGALFVNGVIIAFCNLQMLFWLRKNYQNKDIKSRSNILAYETKIYEERYSLYQKTFPSPPLKEKIQKELSKDTSSQEHSIRPINYFSRKLLNMGLWFFLSAWIFVVIPLGSSPFSELHLFYQVGLVLTITFIIYWFISTTLSTNCRYTISESGMQLKGLFSGEQFLWSQVKSITLQEGEASFLFFDQKTILIPVQDLKDNISFLEKLFLTPNLPISIFFIVEPMWIQLAKKDSQAIKSFLQDYKNEKLAICWQSGEKIPEARSETTPEVSPKTPETATKTKSSTKRSPRKK